MDHISEINRQNWKQQWSIAHYLLLGTVIATVVNVILLLAQADFFIPYCASVPYYLTYFGYYFDGWQVDTYTTTGMVMTFVGLAVYLFLWWMARRRAGWLCAGMVLVIADTVMLALLALLFLENPLDCLLEFIFHIVVIYEIAVGLRARKRLDRTDPPDIPPAEEPWDTETPAESEYSDFL